MVLIRPLADANMATDVEMLVHECIYVLESLPRPPADSQTRPTCGPSPKLEIKQTTLCASGSWRHGNMLASTFFSAAPDSGPRGPASRF